MKVTYTFDTDTINIILAGLGKLPFEVAEKPVMEIRSGLMAAFQRAQIEQEAQNAQQEPKQ